MLSRLLPISRAHGSSQKLKQQPQSLHGPVLGSLHTCCGCLARDFCGTLNSGNGVSLTLLPAFGTLFFLLGYLTQP